MKHSQFFPNKLNKSEHKMSFFVDQTGNITYDEESISNAFNLFFINANECSCQIMNKDIKTVSNIIFLRFHLENKLKFYNHVKHLNKNSAGCNYT